MQRFANTKHWTVLMHDDHNKFEVSPKVNTSSHFFMTNLIGIKDKNIKHDFLGNPSNMILDSKIYRNKFDEKQKIDVFRFWCSFGSFSSYFLIFSIEFFQKCFLDVKVNNVKNNYKVYLQSCRVLWTVDLQFIEIQNYVLKKIKTLFESNGIK